jgi:hypothetical protein
LGLIIQLDTATQTWSQVDGGPQSNQDLLNIYGSSEDHFVAVGGRAPSGGRIAIYDGTSWDTFEPHNVVGLSTVFTGADGTTIVGGPNGYVATLDTATRVLAPEASGASDNVRGIWGDVDADSYLIVGGSFSVPFTGVAVLRTFGSETRMGEQPDANEDGLPDAPLTVTGERPDDVVAPPPDNDNTPVEGVQMTFGKYVTGSFEEIPEGGDIELVFFAQDQVYYFNPVIRIVGFPAEAINKFVSYDSTITFVSSGQVISEFSGSRPAGAATGVAGAIDFRSSYYTDTSLAPEDIVGQTIEITVTVTYDAATPPATGTINQTMFVSSVLDL